MAVTRCALAVVLGGILFAAPLTAQSATGLVTGRVVDSASRQPLSAVSVRIVGSANGALSRGDGTFTISLVGAGLHQVRASRIGFAARTQSVTVVAGGTVNVDIALSPQAAVLSDIVVTGYGTQRREAITGSVATVSASTLTVNSGTNMATFTATTTAQNKTRATIITATTGAQTTGAKLTVNP